MTYTCINVEQAKALQEQGAIVLDIRDRDSFNAGHMQNAIHLDNYSLPEFIANADLDQATVVVCYHGHSSQSAAAYLHSQGFEQLFSMDGGFEQWRASYPEQVVIKA